MSLLFGDGKAGFFSVTSLSSSGRPVAVGLGDVNRDGKLDLVIANETSNSVSVRIGNGAGDFAAPVSFATGTKPQALAIGET